MLQDKELSGLHEQVLQNVDNIENHYSSIKESQQELTTNVHLFNQTARRLKRPLRLVIIKTSLECWQVRLENVPAEEMVFTGQ